MKLIGKVLENIPDGKVLDVRVGLHWTCVVVETESGVTCGLATTLMSEGGHNHLPDVPEAGGLERLSAHELMKTLGGGSNVMNSVAIATINAVLPRDPSAWVDRNAEEVITRHGKDKKVVIVGSFPFVGRLREHVGELTVIEKEPKVGEIHADRAADFIPQADVLAITGMTFVNQTFEPLLAMCSKNTKVLVLGPSTPLHPVLFQHGIDLLSGAIVTDIDAVAHAVSQGANFRQIHKIGVRLVTMAAD